MTLKQRKLECRRIARQLGYDKVMPDIFNRINAARTEIELTRVMTTARHIY